jgi:hypothetical protein
MAAILILYEKTRASCAMMAAILNPYETNAHLLYDYRQEKYFCYLK